MKNKKHTKRIEEIYRNSHENLYEKWTESDYFLVLINIVELLAAIADHLEAQNATSLRKTSSDD